jgi:hypothetical protein
MTKSVIVTFSRPRNPKARAEQLRLTRVRQSCRAHVPSIGGGKGGVAVEPSGPRCSAPDGGYPLYSAERRASCSAAASACVGCCRANAENLLGVHRHTAVGARQNKEHQL